MKRRNRKSRQRFGSSLRKPLGLLHIGKQQKRKQWTFEKLEDRLVFSVAPPIALHLTTVSYGNDTPQGAAQSWLDEQAWQAVQDAQAAGLPAPDMLIMSLPNDPLFQQQWHELNTGQETGNPDLQSLFGIAGQDINVVPAWNMGYDGTGIKVAVIDTGVQITHPDLLANISPTLRFNAEDGSSSISPNLLDPESGHGTSVAGIIGAVANNGIGGSGIAPGVTIVPIKIGITPDDHPFTRQESEAQFVNAFQYALQHGIDITNNSYAADDRPVFPLTSAEVQVLRNSAIFGRNGLGIINVFASGNNGGPTFSAGFQTVGTYGSSSYNAFANSRYVITVTGVDENGLYQNQDGTFTSYPEVGPNVLVAAPTGSNGFTSVGTDSGYGSGIWTTDLVGPYGFNAAPGANGFDTDSDPLADPNYTSRFNGTSAAAPMVSGVIALMLQANPNLTYRDVQEILVRSARQNAEFETPNSGGLIGPRDTWQVNQLGPFRDPDPWNDHSLYPLPVTGPGINPTEAVFDPLAEPNLEGFFGGQLYAPDSNDGDRQGGSRYEPQPPQFTNGAGYTVSQGYGIYAEQTGYGHGVVDAGLAVKMATEWTTLGQDIAPNTEKTFTTSVIDYGSSVFNLPAAEQMDKKFGGMLVPGGIGGLAGFIAYWNEFFKPVTFDATTGAPDPKSGPFSEDVPPSDTRGLSYINFNVPPPQQIDIEWVEVKIDIKGDPAALNSLRLMLSSPEGTQSDFINYSSHGFIPDVSFQQLSVPGDAGNSVWDLQGPEGPLGTGTEFVWTFATNRNWGETTNSAAVIDPVTGEPELGFDGNPIFRNWELHIENWGNAALGLAGLEVVWHGKPIGGGQLDPVYGSEGAASAQRIQGFVGIDTNGDNNFNYSRTVQSVFDGDQDPSTTRMLDVTRQLDFNDNNLNGIYDSGDTINQEPFAADVVVDAYRAWDGVAEAAPVARFLTGADGNYYFDLDVQGDLAQTGFGKAHAGQALTYVIKATDPLGRAELEDIDTPAEPTMDPGSGFTYLAHYKQTWTITPDWFYAPDHDNDPLIQQNSPGEILYDPSTGAPVPFTNNNSIERVPMAVKNINFLLKQDAPANNFDVTGTVISDVNGDGAFNGTDAPAAGVFVYWDQNRNGIYDQGETRVVTDANGQYTLNIDLSTLSPVPTTNSTYQIGVIKPNSNWNFTDPGHDGVETVFAGPGSAAQTINFFMQPPADSNPSGGVGLGTIQGLVFNDLNQNGVQDPGEPGVANFRVFIDTNHDGIYQVTETSALTSSLGTYFFANVQPGIVRLDVVIPNEFTDDASWTLTTPTLGYREVSVGAGGALTNVFFGLDNRADKDWGDLPNSYQTTAATGGPSHVVVPGFQLGLSVDGEVNGVPTPAATGEGQVGDDDDGVHVVSNGGVLVKGANTLNVVVQGVGGLLTGWMDFNGDGHFDESERLQWTLNGTSLGGEADINPGTYNLQITIPASATNGPIAARFRWGEQGLSFSGPAAIGEVEDYFFGLNYIYGDFDRNGVVNQADYNVWRHQKGTTVTPFSGADGNGDGVVNDADYDVWRLHFGQSLPGPGAGSALVAGSGSSGTLSAGGSGTGLGSGAAIGGVFTSLSSVSTVASALQPMTVASGASNSSLLLMDLALGDIDSASFHTSDDSLYGEASHVEDHPSDLALASVLNEDSNWWKVN